MRDQYARSNPSHKLPIDPWQILGITRVHDHILVLGPRRVGKSTEGGRGSGSGRRNAGGLHRPDRQRFPSEAEAWPWREVLELFLGLLDGEAE
jgi:hypothetical protein